MDDANMILSESTIDHSMSESVYRLKAFTVVYYKSINAESNDFVDLVPKKDIEKFVKTVRTATMSSLDNVHILYGSPISIKSDLERISQR